MTRVRLTLMGMRVILLPMVVLFCLMQAQHNQKVDSLTYPPVAGSPDALMATCTPPVHGVFPTGVVIIPEGHGRVRLSHSTRLIGQALDQALAHGATAHIIYGFCA